MSKAYLLVICLLTASFTGCLGFGEDDDKDEENIDDIIDEIQEETNNGNNTEDDEVVTKEKDSDNDGIIDSKDAFPYDKNETLDSDNDGLVCVWVVRMVFGGPVFYVGVVGVAESYDVATIAGTVADVYCVNYLDY